MHPNHFPWSQLCGWTVEGIVDHKLTPLSAWDKSFPQYLKTCIPGIVEDVVSITNYKNNFIAYITMINYINYILEH